MANGYNGLQYYVMVLNCVVYQELFVFAFRICTSHIILISYNNGLYGHRTILGDYLLDEKMHSIRTNEGGALCTVTGKRQLNKKKMNNVTILYHRAKSRHRGRDQLLRPMHDL